MSNQNLVERVRRFIGHSVRVAVAIPMMWYIAGCGNDNNDNNGEKYILNISKKDLKVHGVALINLETRHMIDVPLEIVRSKDAEFRAYAREQGYDLWVEPKNHEMDLMPYTEAFPNAYIMDSIDGSDLEEGRFDTIRTIEGNVYKITVYSISPEEGICEFVVEACVDSKAP